MMFDLIAILFVGGMLVIAAYTALQFRGKFPRRTIDDVTPFLRPAEANDFESLLDPALEVNFRLRLSPVEFSAWQRKRFHLMREYLLRMSHNALVLIEWGNIEAFTGENAQSDEKQALAREMVQAATEFRLYSMLALWKLKLWLLLPSGCLPGLAPSLSHLRSLFGINALGSYQRLKSAACSLGSAYSHDFQQDLLARL